MKTKSTQLAIVKTAIAPPAIVPKPTRTEIVEAMVQRSAQQHGELVKLHMAKIGEINERIKAAAIKAIESNSKNLLALAPEVKAHTWGDSGWNVEVEFKLTATLEPLLREYKKASNECPRRFDADSKRREIREALSTTQDRVAIILANDENVKQIDAILAKIA